MDNIFFSRCMFRTHVSRDENWNRDCQLQLRLSISDCQQFQSNFVSRGLLQWVLWIPQRFRAFRRLQLSPLNVPPTNMGKVHKKKSPKMTKKHQKILRYQKNTFYKHGYPPELDKWNYWSFLQVEAQMECKSPSMACHKCLLKPMHCIGEPHWLTVTLSYSLTLTLWNA